MTAAADHLSAVSKTFADGERAIACADAGLVQEWIRSRRLLAIVTSDGTDGVEGYAIFVFELSVTAAEPSLCYVFPIDATFGFDVDDGNPLLLKVSSAQTRLLFEMTPGPQTRRFLAELGDATKKRKTGGANFVWLLKYKGKQEVKTGCATSETDGVDGRGSPEVSRKDIAGGASIAARDSVVKYQMLMKEDQFTEVKTFSVRAATWNVNGQSPEGPVSEWLSTAGSDPPDVYAVGFQELDLTKEAFIFNESLKEEEWRRCVAGSLHSGGGPYVQVRLVRLVGMMLIVYVKQCHVNAVTNVEVETVGTGIMGKLGNKGGVAIRFDLHNTSVCFVNAHLAAHLAEFERRNQDFHDIASRVAFGAGFPPKGIKEHEAVFWIGDLNYRIDGLDPVEVKALVAEGRLAELLERDQLMRQKALGKIFDGYIEGAIGFVPTYRYDAGTDDWDTSEKCRAPAWTDRILWRGRLIEQTSYRSHGELKVSDHKPVSATFSLGVKVVDPKRYRKVYEDVMKKLDKLENEFLPQVTVDTTEVALCDVRFLEPATSILTCANTGQVPVQFEFVKKPNDKAISKPWLSVEPCTGFIMPGETVDIRLEVYVGKKTAGELTCGGGELCDILVLHLVGGKDIFVTVSGSYKRSSFGSSIDDLCKMNVPIAAAINGESAPAEDDEPYPMPKELWFLCDLIAKMGLQNEQVFLQPGLRSEILLIRDWLDTGLPPDGPQGISVHSVAESLLLFLESLWIPVVPYDLYNQCLECAPNYLQCKQIVAQMPPHHGHVFRYISAFLREVIRHSTQNGIDPKILAALFASIIIRDPPGTNLGTGIRARTNQQLLEHKKVRFFYHFLINEP